MNHSEQNKSDFSPEFGYGGFWRRYVAAVIDGIIVGVVTSPFGMTFNQTVTNGTSTTSESSSNSIVPFIISFAYIIFFLVKQNGQTIGKKIMGLRVVKEDGQPVDLATAVTRYFSYLLSAAVLCLGLISAAFNPKKQGWHDKIANTYVIKTDNKSRSGWIIALIAIFVIFFVIIISGIAFGYFTSKNIVEKFGDSTISTSQNANISDSTFDTVNQKRQESGMNNLVVDNQLCAFAQRRLEQLEKFGKYDDAKGFYEDLADAQVNRSYFTNFTIVGERVYTLGSATSADTIVKGWVNNDKSWSSDTQKTHGCVRDNGQYLIFINATHKNAVTR